MMSRPVAVGLLAVGCLTAAAGGAYFAVRQNAATAADVQPVAVPAPQAAPAPVTAPGQPVSETEAVVEPSSKQPRETPRTEPSPTPPASRRVPARRPTAAVARASAPVVVDDAPAVANSERPAEPAAQPVEQPTGEQVISRTQPEPVTEPAPRVETPAAPQIEELVIPASSVIGLEMETSLTSERARVEDRVEARVTRDVYAEGRLAIPAGSRVIGSVTLVERGGKVKERARLGVRFHSLVLADGRQIDLRTDTIYREGESPSGESSRKIGGAAVGGAVLGAIMGGGKGAILGGAAGAAGGTAAVMAGGRNPATLASGTVVTARLLSPVNIEVERR